jgi:hypothetical protein
MAVLHQITFSNPNETMAVLYQIHCLSCFSAFKYIVYSNAGTAEA